MHAVNDILSGRRSEAYADRTAGAAGIGIQIDVPEVQSIREEFGLRASQMNLVIRSAKNKTASWGRTRFREDVARRLNIKRSAVNEAVGLVSARRAQDPALVVVKRQRVPLIDFRPKVRKRTGVTVELEQGKPALQFKHAFKATMPSGHTGIYLRRRLSILSAATLPDELMDAHGQTRVEAQMTLQVLEKQFGRLGISRGHRCPAFRKVTPEGFAERLPLDELSGPPAIAMLAKANQLTELGKTGVAGIQQKFVEYLRSGAQWVLSGKASEQLAKDEARGNV